MQRLIPGGCHGSSESPSKPKIPANRQTIAPNAGRTVVWVRGDQDLSTVAVLSETMNRAIALDDANLVIDLSDVQFMGAATIGAIVEAREVLRLRARTLALRAPSPCAQRVVGLCGLADRFDADRLHDGAPSALPA